MAFIAERWPVLSGNYVVGNPESNVAICTLTNKFIFPKEIFAIYGEMKTENLGIERVIINTISNANIRYIVVCGKESKGHWAGQSLIAVHEKGLDGKNRIIDSKGAIPFIENVPKDAVERFKRQIIKIVDMIGVEDPAKIMETVRSLPKEQPFEEGFYIVSGIQEAKKAAEVESRDVSVSENVHLDPVTFTVCD
jgi:tetrahydromethanopterin S-methyltransferase subunit A